MKLLESLIVDKRKVLVAAILILAAAAFLRFCNIGWSFSNNGVDEGIMLERARMVSQGYGLYSELPCDQAPLAFLMGAVFDGDVVILRSLTAALSLVAIAACMLASKKQQGDVAMLVTGALLAIDFALLRESRLFSLDGISTFFLALSLPLFLHYIRKGSRVALSLTGLLVGLSAASKLFGGVALVGMILYMLLQAWKDGKESGIIRGTVLDLAALVFAAVVPLIVLMVALGPSDMLNGMVFDQGHRVFDLEMKLSMPVFFGLNLAYALPLLYARRLWSHSKEARFLLVLTAVLLADFIVQPLVFLHHMVLMSPGLAILSGILIAVGLETKKGRLDEGNKVVVRKKKISEYAALTAVLMVGIVVSAGLGSYGAVLQDEPTQLVYSRRLKEVTLADEWVVSGDPLIPAYADRMVPPEAVNVAYRVHPELTEQDLERIILEYNVSVVIVCFRLNDMPDLEHFLASNGYVYMTAEWWGGDEAVLDLFQEGLGHISVWTDAEVVARMSALTPSSS